MIRNFKAVLKASLFALAGGMLLWNCESEADNLGSQFFNGADGAVQTYPVIAYNVNNNDSIRSDASRLSSASLGAFTEQEFGMQKASYVTQVRLGNYAPDFGKNAEIDSVVMVMKPVYAADSATTKTYEDYTYPDGNVPAKKVVNIYPVTKYGKKNSKLTINIHEVTDFLGGTGEAVYSDKKVATGSKIGSKVFDGTVTSVKITKKSDNTDLLTRDASLRIPLDKDFFKSKILTKSGSAELSDASNFIRYFKGLRISVEENDGFIFNFKPNDISMVMYYKYDNTSSGTATRTQGTFTFDLGASNVHFSQIDYDRKNASAASATYNALTGEEKLYAQGMGGPGFGIKIPAETISKIRELYKKENIAILSAKVKLFTDKSVWNNNYQKPAYFTVKQKDSLGFTADMKTMNGNPAFSLVKANKLNENPANYEITITQAFKNVIEKEAANTDFIMNVGSYELSQNSAYLGQNYNTRVYTPHRVVLVGTQPGNANGAQLNIIYTKK